MPATRASETQVSHSERSGSHENGADAEFHITFDGESNFYVGFSNDISEGGLFVATYTPLPVGRRFTVRFTLPGVSRSLHADCESAWVRPVNLVGGAAPGMGLRFLGLQDDVRIKIERFMSAREPLFFETTTDAQSADYSETHKAASMRGWRESNLRRRPAWFERAYSWLRLLAIFAGLLGAQLPMMSVVGIFTAELSTRLVIAAIVVVVVPALIARAVHPKGDPIVAINLTSEVFAMTLLGFAMVFMLGVTRWTRPLLVREADREWLEGARPLAQVTWYLAGVTPVRQVRR